MHRLFLMSRNGQYHGAPQASDSQTPMLQPSANLEPTADLFKGPLLELRQIGFYAEVGADKPREKAVLRSVWSFNVRALPATNETLSLALAGIDARHLQDLELLKRLKEQLAQLNKWKAMEPWAQLDVGGVTWSPWPFPHDYLSPTTAASSSWYREGAETVPDYILKFEKDALRQVRYSHHRRLADQFFVSHLKAMHKGSRKQPIEVKAWVGPR
jgi:hypothetical protein